MSDNENGQTLTVQPTTNALQKSDLTRAGEAANRAAADYLFADYRQRRAKKTIRTQTAALLLWVQYLAEVGTAGELLEVRGYGSTRESGWMKSGSRGASITRRMKRLC